MILPPYLVAISLVDHPGRFLPLRCIRVSQYYHTEAIQEEVLSSGLRLNFVWKSFAMKSQSSLDIWSNEAEAASK